MKILIAGDFCPRDRVASLFEEKKYGIVLDDVQNLISSSDYSIVNFECPVVSSNAKPIVKQGPSLKCTPRGVEAVKYAGFDCVTLANNHFLDYGKEGVKETICTLNHYGMDFVGGGVNLKASNQILYKEICGECLAVINCCEHEFSIATETTAGSNPLQPIQQYYAIKEAKENADKVLVIVHGGHEHFQLPSPRMVETYRFFIDAGADAVVNHHQHCFSGYELYKGKPIFYGLGNFCFDLPSRHDGIWTEGIMVTLDFSNNLPTYKIQPYSQCAEMAIVKLLPEDAFNNRIEQLNETIAQPEKLKSVVDKYYASCSDQYRRIFEPIRNRFILGAIRRGWIPSLISKERFLSAYNFIFCESHFDKMKYWLNNYNYK